MRSCWRPCNERTPPFREAFAVEHAEALEPPVPFLVEFQRGGDVSAYATAYTGFVRAATEPVVRAALERLEEGTGTIACLYERIRDRLLAELERYLFRSFVMAVLLARR